MPALVELDYFAVILQNSRMWVGRTIEGTIVSLSKKHPVVVVTGPRQSGKTSLLKRLFPKAAYFSLDNPFIQSSAAEDPLSILSGQKKVILDEVQYTPELLRYVKMEVDKDRRPGRFFITGSQNLLVSKHISESLAGRAVYLPLLPFDAAECAAKGRLLSKVLFERSFFPEPFLHPSKRDSWLLGYIQTYIQRDIRQIASIGDLRDFTRFLRIAALRNGCMLNLSDMARDVSVSPNTIKKWISILEASYQIFMLEPYLVNRSKRIIKTPKLYFTDPWIAWHLAGGPPREPGALLECSLIAATYRYAMHSGKWNMFYFRTKDGAEVDLILEPKGNTKNKFTTAVEIKSTSTISPSLLKNLKSLVPHKGLKIKKILVCNSNEYTNIGDIKITVPEEFLKNIKQI